MKKLLWLDDLRDPFDTENDWLSFSPIGREVEVIWVKNSQEFKDWIIQNGLPDGICFDHDIASEHYTPEEYWSDYEASKAYQESRDYKEETGLDCAKWLIDYCIDLELPLPLWTSQSANPVGRDNINNLLTQFLKHQQWE